MNMNSEDREETTEIGVIGGIEEDEIVGVEAGTRDGKEREEDSTMADPEETAKVATDRLVHQTREVGEIGMIICT